MRRFSSLLALTTLVLVAVTGTAPALADDKKDVLAAERSWFEAIVKKDATALDKLIASDYASTSDGLVSTKSATIQYFTAASGSIQKIDTSEAKASVYKDAVIVTGVSSWKSKYEGKTSTAQVRYTAVWVKVDGRWQVAAWHGSTLPKK